MPPLGQHTFDGLRDRIAVQPALDQCLYGIVWSRRRGIALLNAFNGAARVVKDGDLGVGEFCTLLQALVGAETGRQPDYDTANEHKAGLGTPAALLKTFLS